MGVRKIYDFTLWHRGLCDTMRIFREEIWGIAWVIGALIFGLVISRNLSIGLDDLWKQIIFAIASGAFGGVIILLIQVALAPSRINREQEKKIADLENKVSKKLRLVFKKEFHQDTPLTMAPSRPYFGSSSLPEITLLRGAIRDNTDSTSGAAHSFSRPWSNNDGRYFYINVLPMGNILVKGCSVLLTLIERYNEATKDWEMTTYKDQQYLKWGGDESADAYFPRDIPPIDGMNADILFIKSNNDVVLTTKTRLINHQQLFKSPGLFRLTISAYSSEQGEAPRIYIIFDWTGDWTTASMIPATEWNINYGDR